MITVYERYKEPFVRFRHTHRGKVLTTVDRQYFRKAFNLPDDKTYCEQHPVVGDEKTILN